MHKLLIANRGEIACRIIRTAKKMGIQTVAIYSAADEEAQHVKQADEAFYIGPAPANQSYLQGQRIIDIALQCGATLIHPGYGFLSENAAFAQLCQDNQIKFIGPPVAAIDAMGSKSEAKKIMQAVNVPLVPGYHLDAQDLSTLKTEAAKIGYPVLLKAAAGGGGKGMRVVNHENEFEDVLHAAKREAKASFGDEHMLIEKYLLQPRHIEIQVFFDEFGEGVYLFERDCSIQRRHQKVIEEAPAPGMLPALREKMGHAALDAARAIGYVGAGTVEFLLDSEQHFYFMEMNTRLQVEHPITEMITGQDLVQWQIKVALGLPLPRKQSQLSINGHAFEARIYAEDANNQFLPSTGTLDFLAAPESTAHVRIDSGVIQGDAVSSYYDPMIAKLIVWDIDRANALIKLRKALSEFYVDGLTTNIDFLSRLSRLEAFEQADIDTGFIEQHETALFPTTSLANQDYITAALLILASQNPPSSAFQHTYGYAKSANPWQIQDHWRMNLQHSFELKLSVDEQTTTLLVICENGHYVIQLGDQISRCQVVIDDHQLDVTIDGAKKRYIFNRYSTHFSLFTEQGKLTISIDTDDFTHSDSHTENSLCAPMNGTVVHLAVAQGDQVEQGQAIVTMEAMKMEHTLYASEAGTVTEFYYQPGDLVEEGAELLAFTPIGA